MRSVLITRGAARLMVIGAFLTSTTLAALAQPSTVPAAVAVDAIESEAVRLLRSGELARARESIDVALRATPEGPSLARLHRRAALIARKEGRDEAALSHWLAARNSSQEPSVRAESLGEICLLPVGGGSSACDGLSTELAIPGLSPTARFALHQASAHRLLQRGDREGALDHLLAAVGHAQESDVRWAALVALSDFFAQTGETRLVRFFSALGLRSLASISPIDDSSRGFRFEPEDAYRQFAVHLATSGRIEQAVQVLALLKQHELARFSDSATPLSRRPLLGELPEAESALLRHWSGVDPRPTSRSRSALGYSRPGGGDEGVEGEWLRRAHQALGKMRSLDPQPESASARGRGAGSDIPPGEIWVHFIAREQDVVLLMQSGELNRMQTVQVRRRELEGEAGALLSEISRGEGSLARLQWLFRHIGDPILRAALSVQASTVVVQSDGVLRYLPLAAMHDGRGYLGDRLAIVHHVGAAGKRAKASQLPATRQLQAMGVTRSVGGMPPLPGVAHELCSILAGPLHGLPEESCDKRPGADRGIWQGEGWLNETFTAARLASHSRAHTPGALLHIGTHFDLRPGNMSRSSLVLGDGTRLTLDAIARLDFSGRELVTLSACETGAGGAEGDEVEGLSALLLRRGANAVLASLWRVDDLSTAALMRRFYAELATLDDSAQALKKAQAAVRQMPGWGAPRYWAGFQLVRRP